MNGVDWNQIMALATAASVLLSIVSGGYTWLSNRDRVTGEKFAALEKEFSKKHNELEKQLHANELEITRLKGRVDALPNEHRIDGISRAVSKVETGLAALTAEVHAQAETVKGVRNAAESINEFLRDHNRDRA